MTKGQCVRKRGDRLSVLAVLGFWLMVPAASGGGKPFLTDLMWTGLLVVTPMIVTLNLQTVFHVVV